MNRIPHAPRPGAAARPLLSVIIPNYNYARCLDPCLESVKAQSLAPSLVEVLIADDGSTDNSVETARAWEERHPWNEFRMLRARHIGRPGPVRNIGLRAARGDLLLCLDPDDVLEPDALRSLAEALEKNQDAALACADYIEEKGAEKRVIRIPEPDKNTPALLRTQNPFQSAAMFRRAVWERIGGYTGATLYEDWDYWVRAAAAGFAWTRVPRPLVRYRVHAGSVSEKAVRDDARAKAAIVLRSPGFFAPEVRFWAKKIMENAPWMPPFPRGVIPSAENMRAFRDRCDKELGASVRAFFEE